MIEDEISAPGEKGEKTISKHHRYLREDTAKKAQAPGREYFSLSR